MRNKTKKVMALLLTLALFLSICVVSSFAVAGDNVTFDVYLVMSANANVPNATFTYNITPDTAVPGSSTAHEIISGPAGASIGSAVFAPGNTTYATVQGTDDVTLASGEKYAKQTVTATLATADFDAPGVYRYKITQATTPAISGVTYDTPADLFLDVYVDTDAAGDLSIQGSFLHDGNGVAAGKEKGYQNSYATNDLTISKTVAGNQGYHQKPFQFTVSISGAASGTIFTVTPSATLSTPDTGAVTGANPATLTAGADGTVSGVFYLKHNQNIVIKGMVDGTGYTVEEVNEDYTATYSLNGGTATAGNRVVSAMDKDADNTVAFTNTRSGTVPTGILMDVAPYVLIVALACAMLLLLGLKKRKTER